jgi:hypothetical protein
MKVVLNFSRSLDTSNLPKRLTEELRKLFEKNLYRAHSKTRVTANAISIKTQERRVVSLIAGFKELRADGFALETPWNLAEKHIRHLVNVWVNKKKQSPGTVENKLTYWLDGQAPTRRDGRRLHQAPRRVPALLRGATG